MIKQGTDEWLQERLGKATASRIADIVAKTKSGYSASRANYMAQLIAERLTGVVEPSYTNAAMAWGTEKEPEARAAYERLRGVLIDEIGFVAHPTIPMSGASPDGLIGDDGLIEIKCPNTATHLDTLLGAPIPSKYLTQMLWQMACTGRDWCDWVSYDPRLPDHLRLHITRVQRAAPTIAELEEEVSAFLIEIEAKMQRIAQLPNPNAA